MKHKILLGALIALMISNMILYVRYSSSVNIYDQDIRTIEERIDVYRFHIDSLKQEINLKLEEIIEYQDRVDSFRMEISKLDNEKIKIIRRYETRLRNIDRYNVTELDSVLSARYPNAHTKVEGKNDAEGHREERIP
jgi:chromosome segregation ATPase